MIPVGSITPRRDRAACSYAESEVNTRDSTRIVRLIGSLKKIRMSPQETEKNINGDGLHGYSEHQMKQGDTLDSPAGMIRRDDEFLGEGRCSAPISWTRRSRIRVRSLRKSPGVRFDFFLPFDRRGSRRAREFYRYGRFAPASVQPAVRSHRGHEYTIRETKSPPAVYSASSEASRLVH